jgi:hypothetical protein
VVYRRLSTTRDASKEAPVTTRLRRSTVAASALAMALAGCAADDPASPDPEDLEEPAGDPEGAPENGTGEAEEGDGAPAVEGDSEGQFDPDEDDE